VPVALSRMGCEMPVENPDDLIDTLNWARRELYTLAFRLGEADRLEIIRVNARLMDVTDYLAQHDRHEEHHADPQP
jgi:hypothetical protein